MDCDVGSCDKWASFVSGPLQVVGDDCDIKAAHGLIERFPAIGIGAAIIGGGNDVGKLGVVYAAQGMAAGSQRDGVVLVEICVGEVVQLG